MSYKSILQTYEARAPLNVEADEFSIDDTNSPFSKNPKRRKRKSVGQRKKDKQKSSYSELEKEIVASECGIFKHVRNTSNKDCEDDGSFEKSVPAWNDEDDNMTEKNDPKHQRVPIIEKLQKRFEDIIGGNAAWSKITHRQESSQDLHDENDDNEKLDSVGGRKLKSLGTLKSKTISIDRVRNLTSEKDVIWNVSEFHPSSAIALTAGNSGVATLVQVDGKVNKPLHTVKYDNFPIRCGRFSPSGREFVVGSFSKQYIYTHDLESGKNIKIPLHMKIDKVDTSQIYFSPNERVMVLPGQNGYIHTFYARTKEWIGIMKMNSQLLSLAFNRDGSKMYTHGDDGVFYEWDMNIRQCVNKVYDSCQRGTSICVSTRDDGILATGCESGSVSIYRLPISDTSRPTKYLQPVRTACTELKFNCTAEILAVASKYSANAVKMIHCDTMTTFVNFPSQETAVHSPRLINFSPMSGYFTVCGGRQIHLYRLNHYSNY